MEEERTKNSRKEGKKERCEKDRWGGDKKGENLRPRHHNNFCKRSKKAPEGITSKQMGLTK